MPDAVFQMFISFMISFAWCLFDNHVKLKDLSHYVSFYRTKICFLVVDIPEDAIKEDSDDESRQNPDERISSKKA